MKTPFALAIGLCTANAALALPNDEVESSTADALLVPHAIDAVETMSEDSTLDSIFPSIALREGMSVKWGGRLMFDTTFITAGSSHPSGDDDGSEFRRARLFAQIDVSEHISAKVQYDFAGQDVDFKDVYIKYKTSAGGITVGHHYQPFSLDELTSSKYITFIERATVIEALSLGRDTGISTSNRFGENTGWALGVFRPVDDSGDGTGDGDYSITGRLTHAIPQEDGTIHLGLAASVAGSRDVTRVRSRPEVHQAGRVVDTGDGTSDGSLLMGFEFAWNSGPNTFQAEYIMNSISDFDTGAGPDDVDFNGYYVSFSRFLTGERRGYNKAGKWNRIKPLENWEGKGLNGAWEAALRYSMLDLTDGAFDEEVAGITAGVNWYLNPYSRIMLNVVRSEAELNGVDQDLTALIARFQVDW